MKLISWNVNGLRAALEKGLIDYISTSSPEVFCMQEIKCVPGDVQHVIWPKGYEAVFFSAQKKGYSGTGIFSRVRPLSITTGIGAEPFDNEGRALTAEFSDFYLVNVYVPNAQPELARIDFRMEWDRALLAYVKKLEKSKPVIFCGDLNVAHEEIDLARPKENVGNPGFSDQERDGFRAFLKAGFIDSFREFDKGPNHYTWWSYRMNARAKNVGWRIDYFMTSASLRPRLKNAWIEPKVLGSDHCPIGLELI